MMRGTTIRRQATLPITFRVAGQPNSTLDFVIDTGFTEDLTLPAAAVSTLNLPFRHQQRANLADGSVIQMNVHIATILWSGLEREVGVVATGSRLLLGTLLLDEQELRVRFHEGDLVSVQDL